MPYLIFTLGVVIGLFALYRFFIKASVGQIRRFFRICIILIYGVVMLFFALSGRMAVSIGLLILSIPFVIAHFRKKTKEKHTEAKENHDTMDE